jgi:hypothetical protein
MKRFFARFLKVGKKWSHVITKFNIPDPTRPIPIEERRLGPSGELIPFAPIPLDSNTIIGCTIDEVSTCVGTYGMGGPGFFGLRLGSDWLVISIWGAAEWILVDDRLIGDLRHDKYGRPLPWKHSQNDALTPHLVGTKISSIRIDKHSLEMRFANDSVLMIDENSSRRPILEGNKKPREFTEGDDLRRAVFLSPTDEIWV